MLWRSLLYMGSSQSQSHIYPFPLEPPRASILPLKVFTAPRGAPELHSRFPLALCYTR